MKKIAGVAVHDKVYEAFKGKKYDVGERFPMPIGTIEIMATSPEVREKDPTLHQKCKDLLDEIRAEVITAQREINGMSFETDHSSFSGYIEDLRHLHKLVASEREELQTTYEKDKKTWTELETSLDTDLGRSQAKTKRLENEERYKRGLEDLQKRTETEITKIRERFTDHVNEFYSASGARLDADTVALLQSGIRIRESEMDALIDKFKNNVTMLRLLGEYAKDHKILSMNAQVYYTRAQSDGSHETSVFDSVAGMIRKAVSSSDVAPSVWGRGSGHFDRLSNEAIKDLDNVLVKPE